MPRKTAILEHARNHSTRGEYSPDSYRILDGKTEEQQGSYPTLDKAFEAAQKAGYRVFTSRKALQ